MAFWPLLCLLHLAASPGHVNSIAPRSIRRLPPAVRETLHARGCRIPESGALGDRWQNVARGHFTAAGSDDWAVLCLEHGETRILVFRGSSGEVFADLARRPLRENLTGDRQPDGTLIFDRSVGAASPVIIRRYFSYRNEKAPPLAHDGINDADQKGSTVWYYAGGRWVSWDGAD